MFGSKLIDLFELGLLDTTESLKDTSLACSSLDFFFMIDCGIDKLLGSYFFGGIFSLGTEVGSTKTTL
jgi:hypothetical protein